jgi:quercetin dioxygenase-like cupin family protein
MRASPRELKAVRAGGLVSRYAVLGDAVFVVVDLPDGGTAGTAVEEACRLEHWGLVLQGEVTLLGRRGRTFGAGTAFYIAPGPVHRFHADARAVIAGFAPVTEPVDDSPATLEARGVEILPGLGAAPPRPTTVRIAGARSRTVAGGEIQTESAVMGAWLFTRSTFGPQSGYAESWCDLAHWGLVLDGSLVLHWEDGELELLGPGDAFHCPGGPRGHRIEVADGATIVDYTPVSQLDDPTRRRAARALRAYPGRTERQDVAPPQAPAPSASVEASASVEDRAAVS